MDNILFLSHRIPYPPNKGDKIRSFNILKHLAERYHVHMGAFVDDPQDIKYYSEIRNMCADACLIEINPLYRKITSLSGLITGVPLTVQFYKNKRLRDWLKTKIASTDIKAVFVFSSQMAQYLDYLENKEIKKIIDFVDMDSEKWRQYSESHAWPLNWIYKREWETLLHFEKQSIDKADIGIFVSEAEKNTFNALVKEQEHKTTHMYNGVDTEYFSPEREYPTPYPENARVIVFTGAMDYWANIDAVDWYARKIFPHVLSQCPDACFYIVGARPPSAVKRLEDISNVHVTGSVQDIRPYLAHAEMAVAPLRVARGLQNKVMEAMAMNLRVVSTSWAMEGLEACSTEGCYINDDEAGFSEYCLEVLGLDKPNKKCRSRDCIIDHFNWAANLRQIGKLIDESYS